MFRYHLLIEYEGTKFIGWQSQPTGPSIQKIIQKIISKLLKEKVVLIGAGRTDAGVHSYGQVAHFDTKKKILNKHRFLGSMNFFLNKKLISIVDLKKKNNKFHSRFSAKKRIYNYVIFNRTSMPSIDKYRGWHVKNNLNLKLMKRGAKYFEGTHDFSAYRSSKCSAKSPVRTISFVKIRKSKNKIEIKFQSKSFLQQQVRSMVGCLKYLGENKWSLQKFRKVLSSRKRNLCAPPAPAHGLYLEKIIY